LAFDLLEHNGNDMRPHPLTERKLKLGTMLRKYKPPFQLNNNVC